MLGRHDDVPTRAKIMTYFENKNHKVCEDVAKE